nr:uncharacterized protein LOC108175660 [Oryctolagus cuniculus]XP_051691152.1 uncharacterized protein LOC108175660 [Oryctolagus cuniculus]XP_051691153.1 uncharacterized protein LOC108175660 [Oryctolagus cuniculus]XP_051691154.1 uncharacterized protein LOC108175660 [Oryctolagus cuniculus]XP_051691155.1 uncharacterized protein LOC108175660 [Oryctolagus cuniculus]
MPARLGLHQLSWELGSRSRSPACVAGIQVPGGAVAGSWFGSRAGTQAQGSATGGRCLVTAQQPHCSAVNKQTAGALRATPQSACAGSSGCSPVTGGAGHVELQLVPLQSGAVTALVSRGQVSLGKTRPWPCSAQELLRGRRLLQMAGAHARTSRTSTVLTASPAAAEATWSAPARRTCSSWARGITPETHAPSINQSSQPPPGQSQGGALLKRVHLQHPQGGGLCGSWGPPAAPPGWGALRKLGSTCSTPRVGASAEAGVHLQHPQGGGICRSWGAPAAPPGWGALRKLGCTCSTPRVGVC